MGSKYDLRIKLIALYILFNLQKHPEISTIIITLRNMKLSQKNHFKGLKVFESWLQKMNGQFLYGYLYLCIFSAPRSTQWRNTKANHYVT